MFNPDDLILEIGLNHSRKMSTISGGLHGYKNSMELTEEIFKSGQNHQSIIQEYSSSTFSSIEEENMKASQDTSIIDNKVYLRLFYLIFEIFLMNLEV